MPFTFRSSVAIVAIFFGAMLAIMAYGLFRFNVAPDTAYTWMADHHLNAQKSISNVFTLWDGQWYMHLTENGYQFDPNGLSNVAFLPLYPLLLKLGILLGGSYAVSGLIINFFALVGAVYFLSRLAKEEGLSKKDSQIAIFFLLAYPTAIFFTALYTEALFVFLTIASFYFMKKRRYPIAALFGFLAALTRIPGVFMALPFVYYAWKQRESVKTYAWSLLIPCGTFLYMALQKIYTGNAFAFLTAQKNWGRTFFTFHEEHFELLSQAAKVNFFTDAFFVIVLLIGIGFIYKKLDVGYAMYAASAILVPLATGTFLSMGRFGMVVFPLFLALAKFRNEQVKYAWGIVSIILLVFYTTQFVNGYWAG